MRIRRIPLTKEGNEIRRSLVRVWVTRCAAAYMFGGSTLLIVALWIDAVDGDKLQIAKDVFLTVLPVATGIVSYWFAGRRPTSNNEPPNDGDGENRENVGDPAP